MVSSTYMNPEGNLSALEKIQLLKKEQEEKRIADEKAKQDAEAAEQALHETAYEAAKVKLSAAEDAVTLINTEFENIRNQRAGIIESGRTAIAEARKDQDVEAIIKTKEGFNDVFGEDKTAWHTLREQIDALHEEKEKALALVAERKKEAEALFTKTTEGKKVAEEKAQAEKTAQQEFLAKKYLREDLRYYFSPDKIAKGEWNFSMGANAVEVPGLPPEEREEAVAAIKATLHGVIEKNYESKKNAYGQVGQDVERIKKYTAEKDAVATMLNEYIREADDYIKRYKNIIENSKENEMGDKINRFYRSYGTELYSYFAYFQEGRTDKDLFAVVEELAKDVPNSITSTVPDIEKIKTYITSARKLNEGMLSVLESNNTEEFAKIFENGNNPQKHFNVNTWGIAEGLKSKENLVVHDSSKALKLQPKELVAYYEETMKKIDTEKDKVNAFVDAAVDMDLVHGAANGLRTSVSSIESEAKYFNAKKEKVDHILTSLDYLIQNRKNELDQKIRFSFSDMGTTFQVPKLENATKQIVDYTEKIEKLSKEIDEDTEALELLKKKKLGIFESKATHSENVIRGVQNIKDKNVSLQDLKSDRRKVTDTKEGDLARLIENMQEINGFDYRKEADITDGITLREMVEKIKVALTTLSEQQFPEEKQAILTEARDRQAKMEAAKKALTTA